MASFVSNPFAGVDPSAFAQPAAPEHRPDCPLHNVPMALASCACAMRYWQPREAAMMVGRHLDDEAAEVSKYMNLVRIGV